MSEKPILFKTAMTRQIIAGNKTETRRIINRFKKGDILWVKEVYQKKIHRKDFDIRWQSPIYMPKKAARIWLRVTSVTKEKLFDIDDASAKAEGFRSRSEFLTAFFEINKRKTFEANPTVYVIKFDIVRIGKIGSRQRSKS